MQPIKIPSHIAIIMDGNGRWAQKRGRPRVYGHIRGTGRVKPIIREADRLGVQAVTLFAFSTENWCRPHVELDVLWKLMQKFIAREADELHKENVRLRVIGEVERLPKKLLQLTDATIDRLKDNTGLNLTLALSYGSRREMVRAAQLLGEDCASGKLTPDQIDERLFSEYLWTSQLGELADVDLVIRTSGERRVSNFLLWQAAYAEFFFTDVCWPDFGPAHLRDAIDWFSFRERRFGGISAKQPANVRSLFA